MATNKELLEAARFRRRRLSAALLRGSADDDLPGVLRAVVAGVLLALMIAGGLLVAGYLGAHP